MKEVTSALPVPAPDGRVVAHGDQDAAVAAEARLPDGRSAFRERERRTPGDQEDGIRPSAQTSKHLIPLPSCSLLPQTWFHPNPSSTFTEPPEEVLSLEVRLHLL